MTRLLLFLLLASCEDEMAGSGGCPTDAEGGGSCGIVLTLCNLEPQGTCTCGQDHRWHCFGGQDLSMRIRADLSETD